MTKYNQKLSEVVVGKGGIKGYVDEKGGFHVKY